MACRKLSGRSLVARFRIPGEPGTDLFLIAGIVSLTIALLTAGGHAMQAALGNPIDALRYK
jgi:hypothetical protein